MADEMAWVAVGANLGDAEPAVRLALGRLRVLTSGAFLHSSLWRTSPVDCPPGSPMFINAAAGFSPRAGETPESLLEKLQALEREFGRAAKKTVNEPRPLDLDLIAFGRRRISSPGLALPHPRAHLRRFVLLPLGEIAPDLILPGQEKSVAQLLAALPPGGEVRLALRP